MTYQAPAMNDTECPPGLSADEAAMWHAQRLERIATRILVSRGFTEKEALAIVEGIVSATMCRTISARFAAGQLPR